MNLNPKRIFNLIFISLLAITALILKQMALRNYHEIRVIKSKQLPNRKYFFLPCRWKWSAIFWRASGPSSWTNSWGCAWIVAELFLCWIKPPWLSQLNRLLLHVSAVKKHIKLCELITGVNLYLDLYFSWINNDPHSKDYKLFFLVPILQSSAPAGNFIWNWAWLHLILGFSSTTHSKK